MSTIRIKQALALAAMAVSSVAFSTAAATGANASTAPECKEAGYTLFTTADGQTFANQGDCVSYVAQGGTLSPTVIPSSGDYCAAHPLDAACAPV